MDAPSSSVEGGTAKRTLPSRTRRGNSHAVGSDIDIMILEAYRSRDADHPPEESLRFELTTNSSRAVDATDNHDVLVKPSVIDERYFTRPEVINAYRTQTKIPTPSVVNIKDVPKVSSRTRLRNNDQAAAIHESFSDQAFIQRHRKYEAFEKRLRTREKEKLLHEQYKLKGRIDQLRAMEPQAFLALPASLFSPPPRVLPGSQNQQNGMVPQSEADRRRNEMLDAATYLEDKYKRLLPPERVSKKPARPPPPEYHPGHETEPPVPAEVVSTAKETPKPKLKASSASSTSGRSPSYAQPNEPPALSKKQKTAAANKRKSQLSAVATPPPPPPAARLPPPPPSPPPPVEGPPRAETPIDVVSGPLDEVLDVHTEMPRAASSSLSPSPSPSAFPMVLSEPEQEPPGVLGDVRVLIPPPEVPESISATQPPKKKQKKSGRPGRPPRAPSMPSIETISPSSLVFGPNPAIHSPAPSTSVKKRPPPEPMLIVTARRSTGTRDRAPRGVTAFGAKLPSTFNDVYEYELPKTVFQPTVGQDVSMAGREPDGSDSSEDDEEIDQLDPSQSEEPPHVVQEAKRESPPVQNGHVSKLGLDYSSPPTSPVADEPKSEPSRDIESEDEDTRMVE